MSPRPGPGGPTPTNRLVPAELAQEVATVLWRERDHFLRIAVVPIVATFAIEFWAFASVPENFPTVEPHGEPPDLGWMLIWLLAVFPMTLFSANCQRIALLGPSAVAGLGLRWGSRETRYLATAVLINLIAALAVALPAALMLQTKQSPILLFLVIVPFYIYLTLRLSFALTAAALERPGFLGWSWTATRGIGISLVLATALIVLPLEIAALLFSWLLAATGLHEMAPLASHFLRTFAAYVPTAATSVTIALAYGRLSKGTGRGT